MYVKPDTSFAIVKSDKRKHHCVNIDESKLLMHSLGQSQLFSRALRLSQLSEVCADRLKSLQHPHLPPDNVLHRLELSEGSYCPN